MRSDRLAFALVAVACGLAATLRFPRLEQRPMHIDEAVHAIKFGELWETGRYVYDPIEYHGPTLYYLTLPAVWLGGYASFPETTEWTYRIVPAVLGCATILLLLGLRDGLGRTATAVAAVLLAITPVVTYYSRYYIQETLLVFFTGVALVAGWRYVRAVQTPGRRRWTRIGWSVLTGLAIGLMHATKETCIITFGAAGAALLLTVLWERLEGGTRAMPAVRRYLSSGLWPGVLTAVLVSVAFYSAFFTHMAGPLDSLRTYATYFDRAGGHGLHDHPWWYYLWLLSWVHYPPAPVWTHALLLGLAAVGGVAIARGSGTPRSGESEGSGTARGRSRAALPGDADVPFLRFVLLGTLILIVVYSAIPYKTPWCMLTFAVGLVLLAGVGVAALLRRLRPWPVRIALAGLLLAGGGHLVVQTLRANGRYAADNHNPFAYSHATSGAERIGAWAEKLAAVHPDGHAMIVKVISPNYWPLPWYLRGFSRVGYWDEPPADADAALLITNEALLEQMRGHLAREYVFSNYGLRPGVNLLAGAERGLFEAFRATQPRPEGYIGGAASGAGRDSDD